MFDKKKTGKIPLVDLKELLKSKNEKYTDELFNEMGN